MKLAEALALRADAVKRMEQMRLRVQANARFQEGEELTEDANALLTEADRVLSVLEDLIRRINQTNAVATLNDEDHVDRCAGAARCAAPAALAVGQGRRRRVGQVRRPRILAAAAFGVANVAGPAGAGAPGHGRRPGT